MKRVISISLGASNRNSTANFKFAGEEFEISRLGTNGDIKKMQSLFQELDGKVDAFGIGGFDLKIYAGKNKTIPFPKPNKIIKSLKTPVYDGSILKLTLEPMVIENYYRQGILDLNDSSAFCIIGTDRFGMAEVLGENCKSITYGDLLASVELPFPIKKLKNLVTLSKVMGPIVVRLPFSWIYPTGNKATQRSGNLIKYFENHDIIAGDFHYIAKYHPDKMEGKTIITNTTTSKDREILEQSGVKTLITTTPLINNRTFGTNVMEAMLATLINKEKTDVEDFKQKIKELNLVSGQLYEFN